jgi:hypothetical protein
MVSKKIRKKPRHGYDGEVPSVEMDPFGANRVLEEVKCEDWCASLEICVESMTDVRYTATRDA